MNKHVDCLNMPNFKRKEKLQEQRKEESKVDQPSKGIFLIQLIGMTQDDVILANVTDVHR